MPSSQLPNQSRFLRYASHNARAQYVMYMKRDNPS